MYLVKKTNYSDTISVLWLLRLAVRTPGFHPGNRGFDSHRSHKSYLMVFGISLAIKSGISETLISVNLSSLSLKSQRLVGNKPFL